MGVMLDQDADGNAVHTSTCIRCDRVDGFPCLVDGKADAQTVAVDPALAHPNLERNYMGHNVAITALSKEPNPTRFQKTLALNKWYLEGEDTDYPWGGIPARQVRRRATER
jgi:hypothetical protein